MIGINRLGALLVAAALFAACTPNESGNIPCSDTNNCPGAYPTCNSRGFCVEAAPLDRLEMVAGDAQSAASGTALTQALTVRALDTNGNAVPNVAVTWTASGSATLSAASTKTGPDGKSQVTATLGKTNGTYTYSASAAGVSSAPVAFTATGVSGPAAKMSGVSGADQTAVVGTTLGTPLSAKVTDINDNPVAGVTVTWAASGGGGSVAQPSAVSGADGIASTTATLGNLVATNTFTASATNGSTALTGSPVQFIETGIPDVAKSIIVAGFPNPASAGTQGLILLTMKDQYGNTAIGYRGTVHVTSDSGSATLPGNYTFTAGDLGSKTLAVTLNTASSSPAQTFSIIATDTADATITGSQSGIVVNPAPVSKFVVTASPSTRTAGQLLTSVVVTAKDVFGNTVTSYGGTVHFTSTDPQAVLPGDTLFTNGTKSFTTVAFKTVGAQTITATDTADSNLKGTSNIVTVTPASASVLVVAASVTTLIAGTQLSLTVTAKDPFGNVDTGYTGTVHFTSTDPAVSAGNGLPANYTFITGDSGTHVFSAVLKTAGSQTITATDTGSATVKGTTAPVAVSAAPTSTFAVAASSPQTAGSSFAVTVTAKDPFGNTNTGYTGFVHLTSSDLAATLPGPGALAAGTQTFTVALNTAGAQTITATDVATGLIAGTSPSITVNPGPTDRLIVTAGSTQVSGTAFTVTVTAKDAVGNTTPGYRGTIHFTSTDSGATLPADSAFGAADAGVKTFNVTLKTPGTQTVTATDTVATPTITGTTGNITVNPGPTTHLVLMGSSTSIAFPGSVVQGVANTVTIIAEDANNNVTPAYRGTIRFTSSDLAATKPPDYAFTATDAGIHTFVGGLNFATTGAQSVAANDIVSTGIATGNTFVTVVGPPVRYQIAAVTLVGGSRAGQVFITGGSSATDNTGTPSRRTYFYDPATGAMEVGPLLAIARYAHTATATLNGQVIIAGGSFAKVGGTDHFEFESCSTNGAAPACTEMAVGPKNGARCNAAAALATSSPTLRVVIAGGDDCAGGAGVQTADVWDGDPASGSTNTIATLNTVGHQLTAGRTFLTATPLPGGKVLFAGGASTASADLFTSASTLSSSSIVATAGAMNAVRSKHTATLLQAGVTTACPTSTATCVLIAGGNGTAGKTWEIYDSVADGFPRGASAGHDLVVPGRNQHAAGQFANGKVVLAGGNDGAATPLAQKNTEVFDPSALTLGFSLGVDFVSGLTRDDPGFAYAPAQDMLVVVCGNTNAPAVDQLVAP